MNTSGRLQIKGSETSLSMKSAESADELVHLFLDETEHRG